MASIVATRELLQRSHTSIKLIVIASQLKGDSFTDQFKVARKLIKRSSLSFFNYKIIESKIYPILLKGHKLFRTERYKSGQAISIEDLAKMYSIPIIESTNLSAEPFLNEVASYNPDYILCFVAQILKKKVFKILGDKVINTHGSYLPQYRGAAQYVWYLLNKDTHFGVTVHYIAPGLDTGDIIFQKRFPIQSGASVYKLHYVLSKAFGMMMSEFVENYADKHDRIKQDDSKASTTPMPSLENMKDLRKSGYKVLPIKDFLKWI
jgi:methionyl-tRNA formyltransferase